MFFWIITFAVLLIVWLTGLCRYLLSGILQLQHSNYGVRKDYSYQPTVNILLPCYNEGRGVYDSILSSLQSDYPAGKLKIIATDDCSADDSWQWIQKAADEFPNRIRAVRNPINLGKTKTILNALDHSDSEIVIIVDSDTRFAKTAIREMIACFGGDRSLGIVGTAVNVKNPDDNALTTYQTYLYFLGFRLAKIPENWVRTVGCVGGCSLAIRRTIFQEIRPTLERRHWFGMKIRDGEDRFITHQVLLHGYNTYIDMDATVWTVVPSTFKNYFLQQLRWRRSCIRDFTFTLRTLPTQLTKLHPSIMYTYVLTPLVMVIAVIQLFAIFLCGPQVLLDPGMALVYIGSTFFIVWLVGILQPDQRPKNPIKLFVYLTWWVVNSLFLTPLAFLTLDTGGWGNREAQIQQQPQTTIGD